MDQLRLTSIPSRKYADYRRQVIFEAYKWDPQVGDDNTVSRYALLMDRATARQLEVWAELLSDETMQMEQAFLGKLHLAGELGLPCQTIRALDRFKDYDQSRHVRLMRFDFHPTVDGWAVSEVNSDVPGGLAEASVLPRIAQAHLGGAVGKHTGDALLDAFRARGLSKDPVAFVHATSYADDRQVMQFIADHFKAGGVGAMFAAPDHIRWADRRATSIVLGETGGISGIVRFFPLEWLANLPRGSDWQGYFDTLTPSCNHPVALFAQSKRLPLVWDRLGVDIPTWRKLLPETVDVKRVKQPGADWVYKPALGRVGEGISIREAITAKEFRKIERLARWHQRHWVLQRRFISQPVEADDGKAYHLCVGAFTVDGRAAGFYGRISPHPRIDAGARDIPILIAEGDANK